MEEEREDVRLIRRLAHGPRDQNSLPWSSDPFHVYEFRQSIFPDFHTYTPGKEKGRESCSPSLLSTMTFAAEAGRQ